VTAAVLISLLVVLGGVAVIAARHGLKLGQG
jgi:hypothetical protein